LKNYFSALPKAVRQHFTVEMETYNFPVSFPDDDVGQNVINIGWLFTEFPKHTQERPWRDTV